TVATGCRHQVLQCSQRMKQHREVSLGARPVLHQVVDRMVTTGNRREQIEIDGSSEYSCNGKAPHRLEDGFRRRWFSFGDAAHLRQVTLRWRTQIVKKGHCSGIAKRSRLLQPFA